MIDAKSFMEFFEREFNVKFVDAKTCRNAIDYIAEQDKIKNIAYHDPTYKSDYDLFLEISENDAITSNKVKIPDKEDNNVR
jgi:hypothetical protein